MQAQTINISLPKKLVKIMDDVAKSQFSSRSDLIRTAVITYVSREKKMLELFAYAKKKAQELKIKEEDVEDIIDDVRKGK